jgi:recombination protein RecA
VVKNRLGPPHRVAEFDIYFDRGIDDYGSWLDVLKDNGLVKQSGAWYTLVDDTTGEELKFQSKDFPKILDEDMDRKESIYQKICDALIMKYKTEYDPDAMSLDTGEEDKKELLLD